jgi:hypothetical protein
VRSEAVLTPENKSRLVLTIMRVSCMNYNYSVTLECLEMFYEEIGRMPYLAFFADVVQDLESSVALFEIKLTIILKILPFLKR